MHVGYGRATNRGQHMRIAQIKSRELQWKCHSRWPTVESSPLRLHYSVRHLWATSLQFNTECGRDRSGRFVGNRGRSPFQTTLARILQFNSVPNLISAPRRHRRSSRVVGPPVAVVVNCRRRLHTSTVIRLHYDPTSTPGTPATSSISYGLVPPDLGRWIHVYHFLIHFTFIHSLMDTAFSNIN